MRVSWQKFLIAVGLILVGGCTGLDRPGLPTALPPEYLPTAVALTVAAQASLTPPLATAPPPASPIPSAAPSATPVPPSLPTATRRVRTSTPTPTITPWLVSTDPEHANVPPGLPFAAIQILNPGPASRVVSPFRLHAFLNTGPKGVVSIELLGEDGRMLMREVKKYNLARNQSLHMGSEISFEIPGVAEAARLQIWVEDEFGGIQALASVDLILLSVGPAEVNPAGDRLEEIVFDQPQPNALIQGGKLRVSGLARLRNAYPLFIELHSADGKIIGTRQVAVETPPGGGYGIFTTDVPYTVSAPTKARLVVWEVAEKIPGMVHLSSVEVMLSP